MQGRNRVLLYTGDPQKIIRWSRTMLFHDYINIADQRISDIFPVVFLDIFIPIKPACGHSDSDKHSREHPKRCFNGLFIFPYKALRPGLITTIFTTDFDLVTANWKYRNVTDMKIRPVHPDLSLIGF